MKKITSILLLVSFLFSIMYIPGTVVNVAATDEPAKHTLPDGTEMVKGKYVMHDKDRLPSAGEVGRVIKTAEEFRDMKPGGKYSLGNDIDLTVAGGHDPLFKSISGNENGIRFDGGGYTIKTDNMIFARIPKNSTFANFVIEGTARGGNNIEAAYSVVGNYPEASYASLCGVAHGGTFKNIINMGNVATQGQSETTPYPFRVGGLIGTCNDSTVLVQNCLNKGRVWSTVHGIDRAVAGMVAYSTVTLYLIKCRNDGQIKNTAESNSAVKYAGGILGIKTASSKCQIIDCSTVKATDKASDGSDMIQAGTYAGAGCDGCTTLTKDGNTTYIKAGDAIPIRNAEDFANMSGNNNYYLLESFRVVEQNKNVFTGKIYGATRKIDSDIPHFAHHISDDQCDSLTLVVEGGYQKITTAEEFYKKIKNNEAENKFYLAADIDLTKYTNWTGPQYWENNREKAKNIENSIVLDGCGYTITTDKPIFVELPGGGQPKNEAHSIMRNIVIEGNVTVSQSYLDSYKVGSYENGNSIGALVGKTNGGIFDNIINKATVTFNGNTNARVGGIIGSTFNDDLFMINCVNNGAVTASVHGEFYGVGGIIGLVGYDDVSTAAGVTANFDNCVNNANVTNNSNNDLHVYAGGIVGVKYLNQTVVYLRDCNSIGKVRAKTAYGRYFADRLQQNFHIIKTK